MSQKCRQKRQNTDNTLSLKLLNLEIRDINFRINFLNKSLSALKNLIIRRNIDIAIINKFFRYTDKNVNSILAKYNTKLKEKFKFLYNRLLQISEPTTSSTSSKRFFKNTTNVQIPTDVVEIVS